MTEPRAANSLIVLVFCWGVQQEDEAESEDDEQPSSAERKEHGADGQTGEQNIQSDSAVELAGAAAETDQAKEVTFHPAALVWGKSQPCLATLVYNMETVCTHVHSFKINHIWFFYS